MTPVSVIIPLWNDASFIEDCLRSIGVDHCTVGEVIVVDNASTDESVAVVDAANLPKVRMIRNDSNVGAAKARQQAMEIASFPLVTFLDSDDLLGPDAIRLAAEDVTARQLDLSIYTMHRLEMDGRTRPFLPPLSEEIAGSEAFARTIGDWSIHPMGVFRRDLYHRATADFAFHGHSDDELLTRHLFLAANRIGGNDGIYYYRDKPRTASPRKIVGLVETNLSTLRLAVRHQVAQDRLRSARANVVRNLVAITRQLDAAGVRRSTVAELAREVAALPIPWRMGDFATRAMLTAVRVMALRR